MKKHFYVLAIIIFAMTATAGFCNDKTIYSASAITVDGIMDYYSSMADLKSKNRSALADQNYTALYDYVSKNRDRLIETVAETNSFNNLGRACQIINSLYRNQTMGHSYGSPNSRAAAQGYFDAATGHRYYKTGATTYAEYTKKGDFLKTVSFDLPVLTKSRNVHVLTKDDYILYRRNILGKKDFLTLPFDDPHPQGWKSDKAMVSLK